MKTNGNAFTTITATAAPELEYPLKDHPDHYTVEQLMLVLPGSYLGPPMDTAHATYTAAYCIGDTSVRRLGPLLEVTRKWATIPAEANIVASQAVTYPAFGSATTSAEYSLVEDAATAYQIYGDYQPRSSTLSLTVPVRRHVRYVLPGVSSEPSIEDVPIYPKFRVADSSGTTLASLETAGASPDAAKYKAWIASGKEIVVRATAITLYLGNIWRVETTYAKAR